MVGKKENAAHTLDKSLIQVGHTKYDPIKHLAGALFPFDTKGKVMVMLAAYFDESYTHPPAAPVYTIAGYVSTAQQWSKFQKEWGRVLEGEGVRHFHMKDFHACKPPYGDWSKEKRARFLQALHKIINRRVMRGFATSVVMDAYNELTAEQKFAFGTPHVCATINCMKRIANWAAEVSLREPMLYVFEKGSAEDANLRRLFNETMTEEEGAHYRVQQLAFENKDCTPLQAADIAAYELTKEVSRRLDKNSPRPPRASLRNLICRLDDWYYMDREHFAEIISLMRARGGAV